MALFATARDAALDWLDQQSLRTEPEIGEIAVAAFLDYRDFRWPDRCWRESRPRLSSWMEIIGIHPSIVDTQPC